MAADTLLSPRELADAIGASESSLRRWIDSGDIHISRTAGGHRRIPLSQALQFIRKMGAVVVRPEVLNLPALPRNVSTDDATDEERLYAALHEGQREVARGLLLSWYLQGRALHELFDGPVRDALHRLGELWKHDERGVLVEHRATDICLGILTGLRQLLPPPPDSAPLAVGAAPAGDPYQIPSLMAATVLADAGLRDINFGANTPLDLLTAEALRSGATLVWLSVSFAPDGDALRRAIHTAAEALAARDIDLVIGGHASAVAPRDVPNVRLIASMGDLALFARERLGSAAAH